MESLSCNSSSFLLAAVLSFLASSARRTESVSLRNLICNLCSIICLFFAFERDKQSDETIGRHDILLHSHFVPCPRFLPCSGFPRRVQTWFCRGAVLSNPLFLFRKGRVLDETCWRLLPSRQALSGLVFQPGHLEELWRE